MPGGPSRAIPRYTTGSAGPGPGPSATSRAGPPRHDAMSTLEQAGMELPALGRQETVLLREAACAAPSGHRQADLASHYGTEAGDPKGTTDP